jgi:hypothetical protein
MDRREIHKFIYTKNSATIYEELKRFNEVLCFYMIYQLSEQNDLQIIAV